MIFTMGNLITLGVVVVILLAYRQLDRDNRSLEKVKKLGDRLQGDLDAYVNRRAEDVKQYAIELDVHQQAAKEILKRLQSVEEGLNARAEGFGAVEKRLGEYDSVLARLMDMTARVDENLARIQDESEFTDAVAKKIEAAAKSLAALDREIPGIREDFSRDNKVTLDIYKDEILADTARKLAETRQLLDEARAASEAAAENAVAARRDAEREFVKAFERSRVEAEKLEDAAFEKLRAASEAKAGRLRETVEEKFASIAQLAKEKAAETQAVAKSFKAEWKAEAEAIVTETKAEVARAATSCEEAIAATEAKIAAVAQAAQASHATIGKKAEDFNASVDERIAEAGKREATALTERKALFEQALAGIDARLAQSLTGMNERLAEVHKRAEAADSELDRHISSTISKAGEADAVLAAGIAEALAKTEALAAKLFADARVGIGKGFEEVKAELAAGDARRGELAADFESRFSQVEAKSASIEADIERRLQAIAKKSMDVAEGLGEKLKTLLGAQREDFEKRAGDAKANQAAAIAELRASLEAVREAKSAQDRDFKAMLAEARAEAKTFAEKLASGGEESTLKVLAAVERRLDEYGSEVESKFSRLEAVNVDIGILEGALRGAMSDMGRRVEGDFIAHGKALKERQTSFEEAFAKETTVLSASMRTLEGELDALKSRAYENVSKQLKVFEDEFFADLRARQEAAEASLAAWKVDRDRALVEMAAKVAAERGATERTLLEATNKAALDTQTRVFDQLEAIRSRADSIQTGIAAEAKAAQENLLALRDGFKQQLSEARKTAASELGTELAKLTEDTGGKVAQATDLLQKRLSGLATAVASEENKLLAAREETARSLDAFRAGFKNAIGDAETRVRSDFESWKKESSALVQSIRADYEGQRDSWISKSREERERLDKEIASLTERSSSLRETLEARITDALAGFSTSYDELVADQGKKARELQSGTEEKILAFRAAAQDLGIKIDTSRSQALAKIEAEAQRLGIAVAEIDREQKAFVAETRVFERAEELAARLGAAIEAMKGDLAGIESRRSEMTELEAQFGKVKKLEDEVNQKLTRFLAEKKRVDSLEEGFARLSTIAQGVDRRLEEVTGQSDALTQAEARIRKILDISTEADTRYERLEKKGQVVEATVEAIDKNFRSVGEIEKTVSSLGAELKRMPERISEIERSLSALSLGKERADEAARKLAELDSIMAEAEKRIAEAQKVREWLARAETRLEEVNRQAEEQLKLLSTLLKEEGVDKRGKGAPPGSVQETVRKLARQGWNTDEIARAVKVSRGEVELILELGGKN